MISTTFKYIFLFLLVSSVAFSQSVKLKGDKKFTNPQDAYRELLKIEYFAFGGVGFTGQISNGESAFSMILSSPKAKKYFALVLSKSNLPAKLYALCGLRELDTTLFLQKVKYYSDTTVRVSTMRGCIRDDERFIDIVQEIRTGFYDLFIHRKHAPSPGAPRYR
jgi:hypothetical protein